MFLSNKNGHMKSPQRNTICFRDNLSKDGPDERGNHFKGITEGKMLATRASCTRPVRPGPVLESVTTQQQEPAAFTACGALPRVPSMKYWLPTSLWAL